MTRVLITGMSGTGKSTLVQALATRGYRAVDLDTDEWSHWVAADGDDGLDPEASPDSPWRGRDWVWREDRVTRLLATAPGEDLFVSGTAANQGKFHAQFDHIVLLSAPAPVLMRRLSGRAEGEYGRSAEELARVLQHVQTVEPLLRRACTLEIDTSAPLEHVVRIVEELVRT